MGAAKGLAFAASLLWATLPAWATQQTTAAPTAPQPQITITSPANGDVFNTPLVDVSVSFSSGKGGAKRVDFIELRANGQPVASFSVPNKTPEGTHTFLGVNLAPVAGAGGQVSLLARAFLGNSNKNFIDSAGVSITVAGDAIAPSIAILSPVPGSTTNNPRPPLSAQVSDTGGSGVDPASVALTLDGVPVSGTVTPVTSDLATISFTPGVDLAEGPHAYSVNAKDKAGNAAPAATTSFRVDLTPPSATAFSPGDGSLLNTATPAITATIHDTGGAGLLPSGATLLLNGILVPATVLPVDPDTLSLTFTPSLPLADGPQAALLQMSDLAGNASTAAFTFTTDANPPLILISSPADGTTLSVPGFQVIISMTDDATGIVPASVVVQLNGAAAGGLAVTPTAPTSFGGFGSVSVTGTLTASAGANTLVVTASDVVGHTRSTSSSFTFSSASDIPVDPAPSFVVDVAQVSAQPLVQEDVPPETGVDAQAWTNRPIMVKVMLTAGGQPVAGVEIKPVVTSGDGSFFFTPAYPRVSKDDGTAGFGFLCPQKPGYTDVSVSADVIAPGTSVSYRFKANLVDAHLILVGDFPGSACYASLSAPTGIGQSTVVVDEVDDQGAVITDASQQRLINFSRIYVTNTHGLLHIPLQLKSNASGVARLRVAYPDFRDNNGDLLTFTDVFDIDHFLAQHPLRDAMVSSGNGQVLYPGKALDQPIIITPLVPTDSDHPLKYVSVSIVQNETQGGPDFPGTVEPIDGQLVLNESDPNKKSFTAIVTNPNGTLSVRYTADPSGVGATLVVDGGVRSSSGPAAAFNPADRVVIREPEIRIVSDDSQEHLAGVPTVPLDQFLSAGAPTSGKVHYEVRIPRSGVGSDSISLSLQARHFDGTDVPSDDTTPPAAKSITLTQSDPDVFVSKSMIFTHDRRVVDSVPTGGDFEIVFAGNNLRPRLNLAAPAAAQEAPQAPLLTLRSDPAIPDRSDSDFSHGLVNNRVNVLDNPPGKARITIWLNPAVPPAKGQQGPTIEGGTDPASGPSLGQFFIGGAAAGPSFSRPATAVNKIQYEFDPTKIPAGKNGVEAVLQFKMPQAGAAADRVTVSLPVRFSKYNRVVVGYYYLATNGTDTPNAGRRPTPMDTISERHRLAKQIWAQNGIDLVSEEELGGKNGIVPNTATPVDTLQWVNTTNQNFVKNLMTQRQAAAGAGKVPQLFVFFIDSITIPGLTNPAGYVPNIPPAAATSGNGGLAPFKPNFAVVRKGLLLNQAGLPGPDHVVVAHELGHCLGLGDTPEDAFNDNLMHQGAHDANRLEINVTTQQVGIQDQFLRAAEVASFLK